jgi:hypothetical protein
MHGRWQCASQQRVWIVQLRRSVCCGVDSSTVSLHHVMPLVAVDVVSPDFAHLQSTADGLSAVCWHSSTPAELSDYAIGQQVSFVHLTLLLAFMCGMLVPCMQVPGRHHVFKGTRG